MGGITKKSKKNGFTFADYCSWATEERWELIDGVPFGMTAPSVVHQEVLLKLARQFDEQLEGKPCRPIVAPVDVLCLRVMSPTRRLMSWFSLI